MNARPSIDGLDPPLAPNRCKASTCDGEVLGIPGRPSARADPGWTVGGVAVAAGSDPGWVEDCGCAVPDSARRARRRADSRTVTFSIETVAQRGGDETGSWGKHKMSRAGQATGESNDYIHGRCARQEPRPHTRLPSGGLRERFGFADGDGYGKKSRHSTSSGTT